MNSTPVAFIALARLVRTVLLLGVGAAMIGSLPSADADAWVKPPQPHVLVILCDDLGYGDLGCYGHPHIQTPHLDRLAASGLLLTSCYSAAPVCSPSRVGLLTGRSPNRAGVYDWISPGVEGNSRADAREQVHLRRAETTLPGLLQSAGYRTVLSGKWHCNSRFNDPAQPQPGEAGFEHWFATQNNAKPTHEDPVNFVRNGEPVGALEGYSCQLVVDEIVSWLDRKYFALPADPAAKRPKRDPLFLYCAFHEPHEPVASPAPLVAQYRGVARNEDEAEYFANVANVDDAVGRLLRALDQRGILDNTLVFFTSDNGPETLDRYRTANRSYGRPGPLRGMKLHTHEAGSRVAGILSWDGWIKPGQTSDLPVSSLDLLPTLAALAGATIPPELLLDGGNFLSVLEDQPVERARPLFWFYYNAINEARVAMRDGDWKCLARLDGGQFSKLQNLTPITAAELRKARLTDFEIYHLGDDPSETTDLAGEITPQTEYLKNRLRALHESVVEDAVVWKPVPAPK